MRIAETDIRRVFLIEDPRDLVANGLRRAKPFTAWYLFSHGLITLVLVAAVLTNPAWAYPAFITAMIGFILHQVYRMSFEVTFVQLAITVLDLVVLFVAWHEYGFVRREQQRRPDAHR